MAQQASFKISATAGLLDSATGAKIEAGLPGLHSGPAVVAFLDLECKYCSKTYPTLQNQLHHLNGVQYLAVQFPLILPHKHALNAAVAAEIARDHGHYNELIADLLDRPSALETPALNRYLQSHGMPGIVGTPASKKYEERVHASIKLAMSLGINSVPTLLVRDSAGSWHRIHNATEIPSVAM